MPDAVKFLPYSDLPAQDAYRGMADKGEIFLKQAGAPVIFANKYLTVLEDEVVFPGGKSGSYARVFATAELQGQHGVVVVPTFEDEVFMIRLFRHPIRAWSLEFPRGFAEPGASNEENALRETREELGVEGLGAEELGIIMPNTGLLATRARVYHVPLKSRPQTAAQTASQTEEAISHVVAFSRHDIFSRSTHLRAVLDEISCAFTLGALMKAAARGLLG